MTDSQLYYLCGVISFCAGVGANSITLGILAIFFYICSMANNKP